MQDEIAAYRNRFADFCLRWHESSITNRAREYALSYGVEHLIEANRLEDLLDLLNPDYLRYKRERFGCDSPAVRDLQLATQAYRGRQLDDTTLALLVRLIEWKHILTGARSKKMLVGAEQALRVRLGQDERALGDVQYYGTNDDRLLVYVELAVRHWSTDPD